MKKNQVFAILFVVFFSYLGFSLPYPILPGLFLEPDSPIVDPLWSYTVRSVLLGAILGIYSLGQFVGSTVIGHFSDYFGRKNMLMVALLGSISGYAICALAIQSSALALFFFGRTLIGFCEATTGIAQTIASDISKDDARVRNFGYINTAASLGWVLGPLIGGWFSQIEIFGLPGNVSLFVIPMILGLCMLVHIHFTFTETKSENTKSQESKFQIIRSLNEVRQIPQYPNLRYLFAANFTLVMGFGCFQYFFPSFLIERFGATSSEIGYIWGYFSLFWVLSQLLITAPLSKRLSPHKTLSIFTIIFSATMLLVSMTTNLVLLILLMPIVASSAAVSFTNAVGVVSNGIDSSYQARVIGFNRSIHSMGRAAPTLIAGFLAGFNTAYPLIAGAFFITLAYILPQWSTQPEEAKESI